MRLLRASGWPRRCPIGIDHSGGFGHRRASTKTNAATPDPQDFGAMLSRHADATYAQLLADLPKRDGPEKLPFNPADAKDLGRVEQALPLSPQEKQLLRKNGFVVVHPVMHRDYSGCGLSFPQAFVNLYFKDLPLLVTTDAVLHAIHRAQDDILEELEETSFRITLGSSCRAVMKNWPPGQGWHTKPASTTTTATSIFT